MIISVRLLQSSVKKYQSAKKKQANKKERFNRWDSADAGASAAFETIFLIISIILFALEVLVMFYAIVIAVKCTEKGPERVVHVLLAIIFTLPYVLIMAVFNNCFKTSLKSNPLK